MLEYTLSIDQYNALYSLAYWAHKWYTMREYCGENDRNTEYFYGRFLRCLYGDVYPSRTPECVVDIVIKYASERGYDQDKLSDYLKKQNIYTEA